MSKNIVKEWFNLDRGLVETSVSTIEEEIRKAEVALENLIEEQRGGATIKRHRHRLTEIDGVSIVYNGNKKIAVARSRAHNKKKYEADMVVVKRWLKQHSYHIVPACTTIKTAKGRCG